MGCLFEGKLQVSFLTKCGEIMAQKAEVAQALQNLQVEIPSNPLISKKTKEKNDRAIWWTFILYKESAPENWEQILNDLQLIWAASPWHDRDMFEDGENKGQLKKPHRHVIVKFSGRKYYQQVKEITDLLNQPIPQKCQNHIGAIQYFLHLNDPQKARYELKDCIDHGIGIAKIMAMAGDKDLVHYENAKAVRAIVDEFQILDFNDIFDYCIKNELDDLGKWISKNSSLVEKFVRGNYNKIERVSKKDERFRTAIFQRSIIELTGHFKAELDLYFSDLKNKI